MSTRKLQSFACFWPGLPQLWMRGSWVGLLVAVGFTALLNVGLLANAVFFEWFSLHERLAGLAILSLVWLTAWRVSVSQLGVAKSAIQETKSSDDCETEAVGVAPSRGVSEQLYQAALQAYLQGDWVATERSLLTVLKEDARDLEARLMLATLWRRQGRLAEASRQLDRLERLEAAKKWENEIARERTEIDRISKSKVDSNVVSFEQVSSTERQESSEDNLSEDSDQRRLAA